MIPDLKQSVSLSVFSVLPSVVMWLTQVANSASRGQGQGVNCVSKHLPSSDKMPTRKGKKPRTQQQQQQSVPGAVGGAAGSTSGDHDSDAATDAGAAAASANPPKSVQPQKDAPRSKLEKNQAKKKRRKANKEEHAKLQLDIDVEDLIYSDINKESGKLETVKLMDKIEKEALQIYPHLGKRTYRVPAVYINSVQDASSSKDGNIFESQTKAPQQCDYRSDRAESFVGDCVYTLSEEVFLNSAVGPFFIIACYQYQHYLARLKDHFQHHPQTQGNTNEIPNIEEVSDADKSATESAEGGKQDKIKGRGEIDLMILTRNHVVFVQIKAVGDNFQEYVTQDSSILKQLKKIHTQLSNDLRVFSHVMKNVLSEPGEEGNDGGAGGGGEPTKFGRPKMSFVGIVPNLERSRVNECFEKNPDLLQFSVDVDSFCGKNLEQLKQVMKEKFGDDLGVDGSNLLFLVDETYVQDYWNSVYQPLRDNFKSSSMWCAGLFGREPERFTPFPLSQVIRCPPAIQRVLYLIDWVKDRKQHYFGADKQDSCDSTPVPCEGASVVTVRHLTCHKDSALHPSQCRECGKELADILDKLDVEKPTVGPDRPDQKLWTLRLSDIVFLVGMPRSLSRVDAKDETRKYRGIRLSDYEKFMQSYENCAMLKEVEKRGYPVKVHTDVSCPGMLPPRSSAGESLASAGYATAMPGDSGGLDLPAYQRINVTWVFAYQGMENKVILFLPGDHAKPQGPDIPEEWTNPELNIPSPGLLNDISEGQEKAQAREGDKAECFIASGIKSDDDDDDDDDVEAPEEGMDTGECKDMAAEAEPLQFKTSERDFEEKDLEDFGRWDLNNLLIAGSRSTSLLIIVTCGKKEMIIKPMKTNT
ncbi:hypothetical protein PoB_002864500 [Plakobranchus ocellatus]|uniref:Uncharacterized protein n=1 Tax=Plakobranchus ocellatus TaxID=259542 RepID=A0AAV4A1U9_9GAST|nr:hypothetical protein PoB_002864500 [Plakobranchus ocellatus]